MKKDRLQYSAIFVLAISSAYFSLTAFSVYFIFFKIRPEIIAELPFSDALAAVLCAVLLLWLYAIALFFFLRKRIDKVQNEQTELQSSYENQVDFLQRIIDAIPNPIYYKDKELRFRGCNSFFETMFGIQKDNVIGKSVFDVFDEETSSLLNDKEQEVVMMPELVQIYEGRMKYWDGNVGDVIFNNAALFDKNGAFNGLVGIIVDISARKDIENRLRYRMKLEETVSSISSRFIGIPMEYIDNAIEVTLMRIGEIIGSDKSSLFLFTEDKRNISAVYEWCSCEENAEREKFQDIKSSELSKFLEELKSTKLIRFDIHNDQKNPGGIAAEIKHIKLYETKSLLAIPLNYEDKLQGFLSFESFQSKKKWTEEDISILQTVCSIFINAIERKRDQDTRSALEKNLRHIQKMESIGQLSAGIAHEINNPVGFISGNTGVLKEYVDDLIELVGLYRSRYQGDPEITAKEKEVDIDFVLEDVDKLLEQNQDGLNRVVRIVKSLKEFSRIDKEKQFKEADINSAIDKTLFVAKNEIKYIAEVQTVYGSIPEVVCNIDEMQQVFLNIIVNAAQALTEAKKVERGKIMIRTYKKHDNVFIEIEDNGPGISKENAAKIFDPFFTTKPIGKGTGLGLNICYDIVTSKHHGDISVSSEPGIGTTFTIKLPIAPPA